MPKEVPITYFLRVIKRMTGWDDFLEVRDLGDLEKRLNIRPGEPRSNTPIPAVNPLYRFVGEEERLDIKRVVEKELSKKDV